MLVQSIFSQIEEVTTAGRGTSGKINSFEALLTDHSLAALEQAHRGLFSYLAFHPAADEPIVQYIQSSTLGSDSGRHIMTLFTLNADARWPTRVTEDSLGVRIEGVDVDTSVHPSYQLIDMLFEEKAPPPLPGIAFFERFTVESEPIYASLQDITEEQIVRERLRTLFSLAHQAYLTSQEKGRAFPDEFAVILEKKALPFYRGQHTSMRQWLIRAGKFVADNRWDIVTAVTSVAGLV